MTSLHVICGLGPAQSKILATPMIRGAQPVALEVVLWGPRGLFAKSIFLPYIEIKNWAGLYLNSGAKSRNSEPICGEDLFFWSLPEVESRTQGSRPRPRTQKKSEAKAKDSLSEDKPSRGQGQECSRPRTQPQVFSKKKGLQKSFSGNLQFIGVPRIFDWGGLNHQSHAMTSSKICLLALNQDFAKGEGLNYSWKVQIRNFGDVLRKPV